ncbi:MAG: MoaD/ThiS family protein [Chloroflexota bacterium]|nr:MAG: MoaD/ThiS family protein [Chloroflexota bacterium]
MSVEVRVPTLLQKVVGGAKVVQGDGATILDLLDDLDRRYPGLKEKLIMDDGQLHKFVNIYINNEDIRFLGRLEARLSEGDVVSILPAVAGGSA